MSKKEEAEMKKCTRLHVCGSRATISCKLGLWKVSGPYNGALFSEARHYFRQYKSDGEYHKIIGGESPTDMLLKSRSTALKTT